jgi:uncharacterized protein (DUF1330 family)
MTEFLTEKLVFDCGTHAITARFVEMHKEQKRARTGIDIHANEFLPPLTKTVSDTGGKSPAAGGKTIPLTGAPPAGPVIVVQWDGMDQLRSWWSSQATKDALAISTRHWN